MTAQFDVAALSASHQRASFSCGAEPLDRYFRQQVSQDVRNKVANCFVAVDVAGEVAAFYTVSASSIAVADLPGQAVRKLPRYPLLPAALIGRLAVRTDWQGRGLGSAMLADAVARARRADVAVFTLIVDAKDDAAAAFYGRFGFVPLRSNARRLFFPLAMPPPC